MSQERRISAPFRMAVAAVFLASAGSAQALTGNDTGGMIPWSREVMPVARDVANDHCARYGRFAVITSVHAWPGGYIGFACKIYDRWGPHRG